MKHTLIITLIAAMYMVFGASCEIDQAATKTVPRSTATNCENVCVNMGLRMTAVVVIMNSAGCVCEKQPTAGTASQSSTAIAGSAIIHAAQQAAAQQKQQQQTYQARR